MPCPWKLLPVSTSNGLPSQSNSLRTKQICPFSEKNELLSTGIWLDLAIPISSTNDACLIQDPGIWCRNRRTCNLFNNMAHDPFLAVVQSTFWHLKKVSGVVAPYRFWYLRCKNQGFGIPQNYILFFAYHLLDIGFFLHGLSWLMWRLGTTLQGRHLADTVLGA